MAEGLEALLRSAQATLSAASATLAYPPPKSGAQKLRRPSRWRPLEQGLWRRPLSVWQGGSGGSQKTRRSQHQMSPPPDSPRALPGDTARS